MKLFVLYYKATNGKFKTIFVADDIPEAIKILEVCEYGKLEEVYLVSNHYYIGDTLTFINQQEFQSKVLI